MENFALNLIQKFSHFWVAGVFIDGYVLNLRKKGFNCSSFVTTSHLTLKKKKRGANVFHWPNVKGKILHFSYLKLYDINFKSLSFKGLILSGRMLNYLVFKFSISLLNLSIHFIK